MFAVFRCRWVKARRRGSVPHFLCFHTDPHSAFFFFDPHSASLCFLSLSLSLSVSLSPPTPKIAHNLCLSIRCSQVHADPPTRKARLLGELGLLSVDNSPRGNVSRSPLIGSQFPPRVSMFVTTSL